MEKLMAEKLDPKETVTFGELLMSNTCTQKTLINLLEKKGLIDKKELLEKIKRLKKAKNTTTKINPQEVTFSSPRYDS